MSERPNLRRLYHYIIEEPIHAGSCLSTAAMNPLGEEPHWEMFLCHASILRKATHLVEASLFYPGLRSANVPGS